MEEDDDDEEEEDGEENKPKDDSNSPLPVNSVDELGRSALIVAAQHGRASCVEILIQAGSNVNLTDKRGYSGWL